MLINCQEQLEVVGSRVVPVLRARKPQRLSHFKGVSTGLGVRKTVNLRPNASRFATRAKRRNASICSVGTQTPGFGSLQW